MMKFDPLQFCELPEHQGTVSCPLAQKFDQDELVSFREVLVTNSIQVDALVMLMIEGRT